MVGREASDTSTEMLPPVISDIKLTGVDKCFGEKQAMAICFRPVSAQALSHRGKCKGSEVREAAWRTKNEKPGIVGNQVQAGELELLLLADPLIAWVAF